MAHRTRPYRSVLYLPASRARTIEKAKTLPTDAIIFDLEDAVSPDEKPAARATLAAKLPEGGFGARVTIVRVNGLDTEWGAGDVATLARVAPDIILLPKVDMPSQITELSDLLDDVPEAAETRIWAMIETPMGVANARSIAAAPRMDGFVMGTNDLAKELGCRPVHDRMPLITSLQMSLLAARAAGIVCIDGVYNAFKDEDGLRAECEQGRDMGFDGKTLIHPAQLAIANAAFAPDAEDVDLARRQIAAFDAALAEGKGVAVLDGKIVENLHVATARETLAKAEAIAAMEAHT